MNEIVKQRIRAFSLLGAYMRDAMQDPGFRQVSRKAQGGNVFFLPAYVDRAVRVWGEALTEEKLGLWLEPYRFADHESHKAVALVMAGNIPLVGFHDYLCALLCGMDVQVKLSSKDAHLLPFLHAKLLELVSGEEMQEGMPVGGRLEFPAVGCIPSVAFTKDTVHGFDAIIATGSGNTFRYFEYYFGRYPHLLRRNRSSCAVLDGTESEEDLAGLADDALSYFGLGCRNVSKLFVPEGYDFASFMRALLPLSSFSASLAAYKDNYDYHKAVYLVDRLEFLDNGSALLLPSAGLASPMSVLYYEYYQDREALERRLSLMEGGLQCVAGKGRIPFGTVQSPGLADYADGVDTLAFLLGLGG